MVTQLRNGLYYETGWGPAQFANFLERINIPTAVEAFPSIALVPAIFLCMK
jgi:hypothetical protein